MAEQSAMAVEPIILVKADDPEKRPQLYACPKCGQCNSPRIYMARDDVAHEAARMAAVECYKCKTHNNCQHCGKKCEKHWLACDDCRRKQRFEAAKEIPVTEVHECFGFDSGSFYDSPEEAADDGEEWVYASTFRSFAVDGERLEESILDDHHEDASAADLIGLDALWDAIEKFNKAQTSGTFDEDRTRIANVTSLREPDPSSTLAEA